MELPFVEQWPWEGQLAEKVFQVLRENGERDPSVNFLIIIVTDETSCLV